MNEHWAEEMRALHGIHVHGFPNLLLEQILQAAFLGSNIPHNCVVEATKNVVAFVDDVRSRGNAHAEAALRPSKPGST